MFLFTEDTQDVGAQVQFAEMALAGEAEELASMGFELAESYAGLQLGFARLEGKAIREQAGEGALSEATTTLLSEGVKEFFGKAKDFIVKYWNKFVNFLKSAISRVSSFLTAQDKFIRTNRDALKALKDDQLSEITFKRTQVIANPAVLTAIQAGAPKFAKTLLNAVEKGEFAKETLENFQGDAVKAMGITGEAAKADSLSAAIKMSVTGVKDKEATMTSGDVANAIAVMQTAGKVTAVLKDAQAAASNAVKLATSRAKMGIQAGGAFSKQSESDKQVESSLSNLKSVSPRIGSLFSAAVSTTASAASNAKSVLSKALAGKTSLDEDAVSSVLAAYMA